MLKFKLSTPELLKEFGEKCMKESKDSKYIVSVANTWRNAMKRDCEFDINAFIVMSRNATIRFGRTVKNERPANLRTARTFIADKMLKPMDV